MFDDLLKLNIVTGPVIDTFFVLSVIAVLYLLIRKPTRRWVLTALIAIVVGALIGLLVLWLCVYSLNLFGGPLTPASDYWIVGVFAAIALAIVNLWSSRWWRKLIAALSIVVFLITATLGVNASYGLNPTVASLLQINVNKALDLSNPPSTHKAPNGPLWKTWKPPPGMPKKGKIGTVSIPPTQSGFQARQAEVYLPPAAQVKNPPPLPFVLMMMGQPGNPDASFIGNVLDTYASENKGLAPIVVVADQLGNPANDPLCLNSPRGNVETYIEDDVVNWAKTHLNILENRDEWTVAGYSAGGQCAIHFGAKYPDVWGNILDVSGEEYPGTEEQPTVLKTIFGGNQAAYDAVKPANILAKGAPYPDTYAIFTVGSSDAEMLPEQQVNYQAATKAGMKTTFFEIPGGDHGVVSLNGGLVEGFKVLYPRLGLSAP